MNLSLYNIEQELLEVLQLREEVANMPDETPAETEESLKAIDDTIRAYVAAEVHKVDGIAAWIRECKTRAQILEVERQRITDLIKTWDARGERMKAVVIAVMQEIKLTKLKGSTSTLRIQDNPPSVEVVRPGLVPDEYRRAVVKMPTLLWRQVCDYLWRHAATDDLALQLFMGLKDVEYQDEPAKTKIAEELKQVCPACNGMKKKTVVGIENDVALVEDGQPCDVCGGTGRRGVPGCTLITDKVYLRTS